MGLSRGLLQLRVVWIGAEEAIYSVAYAVFREGFYPVVTARHRLGVAVRHAGFEHHELAFVVAHAHLQQVDAFPMRAHRRGPYPLPAALFFRLGGQRAADVAHLADVEHVDDLPVDTRGQELGVGCI